MQKKQILGYVLGGFIALAIAVPALMHNVSVVSAAPATGVLTSDELFGGEKATGAAFAANAGLGTGSTSPGMGRARGSSETSCARIRGPIAIG